MDAPPPADGHDYEILEFQWDSSHGHIVEMLRDRPERGIVIDLGCGSAPHAEPLRDAGFAYVGLDVNRACVDALVERGFAAGIFDLAAVDGLAPTLDTVQAEGERVAGAPGVPVVAVLALDVIEHLARPHLLLAELHTWMAERSVPVLGLSVPNVSHRDVGVRLLGASWALTPTGLLDATHLRFFTDTSLTAVLASCGFDEVARNDSTAIWSDQHWPVGSPLFDETAPAGRFLTDLRARADEHGATYQFVRLFSPRAERRSAPTLLAARRTDRDPCLAVVCSPECRAADVDLVHADLAAQTDDRWVLADAADAAMAECSHVAVVGVGQRLAPNWVAQFLDAGAAWFGMILRCAPHPDLADVAVGGAAVADWPDRFDPIDHARSLRTPPAALAFPLPALAVLGHDLGDGTASTVHDLLVALAPFCGVHDTGEGAVAATMPWRIDRPERPDAAAGRSAERGWTAPTLVESWVVDELVDARRHLAERHDALLRVAALEADNHWLNAELRSPAVRLVRRLLRRPARRAPDR